MCTSLSLNYIFSRRVSYCVPSCIVPSAITGLFVEATTNPTFAFTMVAGSPAERMTGKHCRNNVNSITVYKY